MLSKLLKYDLKYMLKSISVFYILSIISAVITRILFSLEQTVVIDIMGQISMGFMISMLASTLINTMMRSWVRFKESIYGDESYLTHTLPVTKSNIYQSKFLLTLIYLFVGFLVIVLSLFIAYYTEERWDMLKGIINGLSSNLNIATIPFVLSALVILFLELFNAIQCGFIGIVLGYKNNNNKLGMSVVFGFTTYTLGQIFTLLGIFIVGLCNNNIMALFTSNTIPDINVIKLLIVLAIVTYTTIIAVVNILSVKILKKGVNVE